MMTATSSLFSVGEAARLLGEPLHRLQFAIRTRRLVPSHRVGGRHVLNEGDLERARQLLSRKAPGGDNASQ
jgi:hypothetical protein